MVRDPTIPANNTRMQKPVEDVLVLCCPKQFSAGPAWTEQALKVDTVSQELSEAYFSEAESLLLLFSCLMLDM